LILGRTSMPTLSFLEEPPCTLVLLIGCRRKSLLLHPPPSRSRLLLLLRGSTLSGLEDQFLPPSPPSNRCGSPSRSTMSLDLPSFTGSASKRKSKLKKIERKRRKSFRTSFSNKKMRLRHSRSVTRYANDKLTDRQYTQHTIVSLSLNNRHFCSLST